MNVRTCMLLAWLGTRLLVSGADNLPETNAPPATLATNSTALVPLSAAANVAPPTAATPAVAKATPENVPSVPATTANLLPEYYHLNTEAASWMGLILGVAAMFSVTVIICCWLLVRRRVPPVAPASGNNLPVPTAQILPLITTTVKETLANELAVQRRELLVSQQSATSDLAHLAHRLEALQSQALERSRHHPLRLPDPHREVPVKIFCECGQKYSFEVHPVDGQMPFAVTCPACEEDGTDQANHFLARLLNSVTQPLPRISYRGWIPGAMPEKMAQGTPSSPEVNGHSEALNGNDPAKPIPTAECVTSLLATAIHLLETGRAEEATSRLNSVNSAGARASPSSAASPPTSWESTAPGGVAASWTTSPRPALSSPSKVRSRASA